MRRTLRFVATFLSLAFLVPLLANCSSTANSPDLCSFVVGDGQDGRDSRIRKIGYPGQNLNHDSTTEEARYIPCQPRNFIANDGSVVNVNGDRVGDRFTPTEARTSANTPVEVYWSSYWTVNQDPDAMGQFYELCLKYRCYSSELLQGDANFSTPGWNGMLGENFGPAVDQALRDAMRDFDDTIWSEQSTDDWESLALKMSEVFAEKVRTITGYDLDLFCGSGSASGWDNPASPGQGEFTCANVRFVIDSIETTSELSDQVEQSNQTERLMTQAAERLQIATEVYGPDAAYWLALQDTLDRCGASTTCVVGIIPPGADPENLPTVSGG